MELYYGKNDQWLNITDSIDCFKNDDFVYIPKNDITRFNKIKIDPIIGVEKEIKVILNGSEYYINANDRALIDLTSGQITFNNDINNDIFTDTEKKLQIIHQNTLFKHGDRMWEYNEQLMSVKFLTGNEKVLEIGGNIGRNSIVIAEILRSRGNDGNLVVLETNKADAKKLEENRNINNYKFHIEPVALSARKLIQQGWDTKPHDSDKIPKGYFKVDTVSFEYLTEKYGIFDTLVLDCEGAFYYILVDFPEILNNVKLILIENDFHDKTQGDYVHNYLINKGFKSIYKEAGGWGHYKDRFFECFKLID